MFYITKFYYFFKFNLHAIKKTASLLISLILTFLFFPKLDFYNSAVEHNKSLERSYFEICLWLNKNILLLTI